MQALRFEKTGDLSNLSVAEVPRPKPQPGDVLIEVRAAGLNPSDVKNVLGKFPYTKLPCIPGRDFAGVVAEGPAGLVGREVWGTGKDLGFAGNGAHAAYLTLAAESVVAKPASLSFVQAASCGVPYSAAWDGIERSGLKAGDRLLVIGAGAVGMAALGLARWKGAEVAAAVRRPEQAKQLSESGIPAVLLDANTALGETVKSVFPGGADAVFETTGFWAHGGVNAMKMRGTLLVLAAPPSGKIEFPVLEFYRKAGTMIGVNNMLYDSKACVPILNALATAFDSGKLAPPSGQHEVGPDGAVDAYRALDKGASEKVVFTGFKG